MIAEVRRQTGLWERSIADVANSIKRKRKKLAQRQNMLLKIVTASGMYSVCSGEKKLFDHASKVCSCRYGQV